MPDWIMRLQLLTIMVISDTIGLFLKPRQQLGNTVNALLIKLLDIPPIILNGSSIGHSLSI